MTSYFAWISWTLAVIALAGGYVYWNGRPAFRAAARVAERLGASPSRAPEREEMWEAVVRGRRVFLGFPWVPVEQSCSPGWNTAGAAVAVGGGAMASAHGRGGSLRDAVDAVGTEKVRQLVIEVSCRNPSLVDVRKTKQGFELEGNMAQLDAGTIDRLLALRLRAHEAFETGVDAVRFRMDLGFLRLVREPWLAGWLELCLDVAEALERAAPPRPRGRGA